MEDSHSRPSLFGRLPGEPWEAEGAGLSTLIFNLSGPTIVIVSAALAAGMDPGLLSAMLGISFLSNGLITVWLSARKRLPYLLGYNLTGTVAWLAHYSKYPPGVVVAALLAAGLVLLLLSYTQVIKAVQQWVPVPIMLSVFIGAFFPLILTGVKGAAASPLMGAVLVLVMLLVRRTETLKRWVPPVVVTTLVALAWIYLEESPSDRSVQIFLHPQLFLPVWDWSGVLALTVPFVLTAILIQNTQAVTLMRLNGFPPDVNLVHRWGGIGGILSAPWLGITPTMAAPLTTLVSGPAAGHPERRWVASLVVGAGWLVLAPVVPALISALRSLPSGILALLGFLALIDPFTVLLQNAFGGRHPVGALCAFTITLSGISFAGFSAPVIAMVAGVAISWLAEPLHFDGSEPG